MRTGFRSTGDKGLAWFLMASASIHGIFLLLLLFQKKPLSLGYMQSTTVTLLSEDDLKKSPAPKPESSPVRKKVEQKKTPPAPPPAPKPVRHEATPVVHKRPAPKLVKKIPAKRIKPIHKPATIKKVASIESHKHTPEKKPSRTKNSVARKMDQRPDSRSAKSVSKVLTPNVPVKMDMVGQRFPTYLQHLLISRIKSNWEPPPGSHGLEVTLSFVLKKDGTLAEDPVLVTRSGSSVFDEAGKFAILRSAPFPPFPPSYGKDREVVTVTLQATKRQGF